MALLLFARPAVYGRPDGKKRGEPGCIFRPSAARKKFGKFLVPTSCLCQPVSVQLIIYRDFAGRKRLVRASEDLAGSLTTDNVLGHQLTGAVRARSGHRKRPVAWWEYQKRLKR